MATWGPKDAGQSSPEVCCFPYTLYIFVYVVVQNRELQLSHEWNKSIEKVK